MDYYAIGQRVRSLRRAQGLSQERLAELVNISVTHMSHIETGSTKLSLPVLAALSQALDASTDALLFGCAPGEEALPAEVTRVLETCTPGEARFLAELLKSAKQALDRCGGAKERGEQNAE